MRWWKLGRRDADLERELRSDLDLEDEEQRESGVPAEEARYAAQRAFGNATLIREHTHEAWGWAPFEHLWQDVRYGLRQFVRNPGFTVVAVTTLGVGIGVNTTIFSAVSAILLRKPPVKAPDTLCAVSSKVFGGDDLRDRHTVSSGGRRLFPHPRNSLASGARVRRARYRSLASSGRCEREPCARILARRKSDWETDQAKAPWQFLVHRSRSRSGCPPRRGRQRGRANRLLSVYAGSRQLSLPG